MLSGWLLWLSQTSHSRQPKASLSNDLYKQPNKEVKLSVADSFKHYNTVWTESFVDQKVREETGIRESFIREHSIT